MLKICTEKFKHLHYLILKCVNVQHTWKIVSNLLSFGVKWKQTVLGSHSIRNETTARHGLL